MAGVTRTKVTWNGDKIPPEVHAAAVKGVRLAAEHLLQKSRELVPIEEGTLERSGAVSVDEAKAEAAVSYDTVYAARQHEELTWKHDPGRQAKYLEQPAHTEMRTMGEIIGASVRRSMERG